jgi:hypothetical protein
MDTKGTQLWRFLTLKLRILQSSTSNKISSEIDQPGISTPYQAEDKKIESEKVSQTRNSKNERMLYTI